MTASASPRSTSSVRGPGDFFGTRQSGLPEFRVADLLRDAAVLEEARGEAVAIVKADPRLIEPEHRPLRAAAPDPVAGEARPGERRVMPHMSQCDEGAGGGPQGTAAQHGAGSGHPTDGGPRAHRLPRHADAVSAPRILPRSVRGRRRRGDRGALARRAVRGVRRAGRARAPRPSATISSASSLGDAGARREGRCRPRRRGARPARRALRRRLPRSALRFAARRARPRRARRGRRARRRAPSSCSSTRARRRRPTTVGVARACGKRASSARPP